MLRLVTFLLSMTFAANAMTAMAGNPVDSVACDSACSKADCAGQTARSVSMFYPKPDMSGVGVSGVQSNSLPGAQVTVPQKVSRKTEAAAVAAGLVVEGIAKELNPDILTPHDRAVAPPFGVAR